MVVFSIASKAHALTIINNPILPVNEPIVSAVTTNSATVSVSSIILNTLTPEQVAGLYFEYYETQKVCIMIYPTPEHCLPKKTPKGQTSVVLQDLKSNTFYTVSYKTDNTIACVTTPCPSNQTQSGYVEFKTSSDSYYFDRNLMYRSRGSDVVALQDILRDKGYFNVSSTGYFGPITFRSVKEFQKNNLLIPDGIVGPKTRAVLNSFSVNTNIVEESFEGVIQSVSTGCYVDGECSVTIDGKKVVTTIGWSQQTVGSIKGSVNNIGDIQTSRIGSRASVYAKKINGGYSLYGSVDYYIEVK